MRPLTRRAFALAGTGGAAASLAACAPLRDLPVVGTLFEDWPRQGGGPVRAPDYAKVYGPVEGEPHPVPAFDYTVMDPGFLRADVAYRGAEPAGTIVVEPRRRLLYLVERAGRATRYGIGIGREAEGFAGVASVAARRAWPDWSPSPAVAVRLSPAWARLGPESGQPRRVRGGPKSPRGARALYLTAGGQDTGYVIHGTPEPGTIGTEVVSGCVRMINQDVIDLFRRTPLGTRVVVLA